MPQAYDTLTTAQMNICNLTIFSISSVASVRSSSDYNIYTHMNCVEKHKKVVECAQIIQFIWSLICSYARENAMELNTL